MVRYLTQRFITTIVMLVLLSFVIFVMVELPPGDYAERQIFRLKTIGVSMTEQDLENLRHQYGLDRPWHLRYFIWMRNIILRGDFGMSFGYRMPVTEVIGDRLGFTLILAFTTIVVIYATAIPIGIYSALHQYSVVDYIVTILGYAGLCVPNFLLALILMYLASTYLGISPGLFSAEFQEAPWSLARLGDMLKHLWIPVGVLSSSAVAFQVRTMRATLLDEKDKLYVTAARAKGLPERTLLLKYPVRTAINPIISTMGWELTRVVSGAPIIATVLAIPDMGPIYLKALLDQDVYLSGTLLMLYSALVILGTFLSDIVLALLDPQVREGRR